jgi:rhodanese-related sulfurtransferase
MKMKLKKNLLLLICCISLLTACNTNTEQTTLSVADFEKGIAEANIQLLDVRTPGEYQSGHLKNAMLADWNNETEFQERVKALDKTKPVYTYCLSGARSNAATDWLKQNGFIAYNLSGGIAAWKNADKPVDMAEPKRQIILDEYMAQIPKDKTVLVDISAVWCPPCKVMAPIIDSLVRTNGTQFVLVKVDGGEQSDICKELKIEGFPTFIIYKQGKEVWRKQGLTEAKEFVSNF